MHHVYRVPFSDESPRGPVEALPGVWSERRGWLIDARDTGDYSYGCGVVLIAARSAAEALELAVTADDHEVCPGALGDNFIS